MHLKLYIYRYSLIFILARKDIRANECQLSTFRTLYVFLALTMLTVTVLNKFIPARKDNRANMCQLSSFRALYVFLTSNKLTIKVLYNKHWWLTLLVFYTNRACSRFTLALRGSVCTFWHLVTNQHHWLVFSYFGHPVFFVTRVATLSFLCMTSNVPIHILTKEPFYFSLSGSRPTAPLCASSLYRFNPFSRRF